MGRISRLLGFSLLSLITTFTSCRKEETPTAKPHGTPPYKVIYRVSARNTFILNGVYTNQDGAVIELSGNTPWSITLRDVKEPSKLYLKGHLTTSTATRSIDGEASITITDAEGRTIYTETDKFGQVKAQGLGFLTNYDIARYTTFDLGIN